MKNLFNLALSFFLLLAALVTSCNDGPDLSNINVDIKLIPFYEDLNSIPPDSVEYKIEYLKSKYDKFLDVYSAKVIRIGSSDDADYAYNLKGFLEYKPNKEVFLKCKEVFGDLNALKSSIDEAYKHYLYYFPHTTLPDIYLHISGFNQSMIADSGLISISVDKYLGADCKFYELLAIPVYMRRKMTPEKVVPDLMRATAYINFPQSDSIDDVANNIIYQGKALWFVKKMIPDINDTLLFDYTPDELKWCKNNESKMWETMVEKKHVFNNERMVIQKYIGDAPFTNFFTDKSPGRAGTYIGYQIVKAYMDKHPELTLKDLMLQDNGHLILRESGYRP